MKPRPTERVELGARPIINTSENHLTPENIYKIYHEAIEEDPNNKGEKFKERFKEKFKEKFKERFNLDYIGKLKKTSEERSKDYFSETFSDERIDLLFNQLNSVDLETHFSLIPTNTWTTEVVSVENTSTETKNSNFTLKLKTHFNHRGIAFDDPIESESCQKFRSTCFECHLYRSRVSAISSLVKVLKEINSAYHFDKEKIIKVLSAYLTQLHVHASKNKDEDDFKKAITAALESKPIPVDTQNNKDSKQLANDSNIKIVENALKKIPLDKIRMAIDSVKQPSILPLNENDQTEHKPGNIVTVEDTKIAKVAEFKNFLKKIDPYFEINKAQYEAIILHYHQYEKCEEEFKIRKTGNLNIELIGNLTKSEKALKETISSCLQLPPLDLQESSDIKVPKDKTEERKNQIKDKDFLKVLNYLKHEEIKYNYNYNYNDNQGAKDESGIPQQNDILGDTLRAITEIPNTILKVFGCIRTDDSSTKGSGPSNARE